MPTFPTHLLRAAATSAVLASTAISFAIAQTSDPAISLAKTDPSHVTTSLARGPLSAEGEIASIRNRYRHFGTVKVGNSSARETFTLNFTAATRLTDIAATNDFHVSGGSCAESRAYAAGEACTVEVTFTPRGPGHRSGRIEVSHTASAKPFLVPTGGEAVFPAVAFIPAQISTVAATYVNKKGLLLKPQGLATDGGDSLYIADTGNNLIRYMNSTGALSALAGGGTDADPSYSGSPTGVKLNAPYGITILGDGVTVISDTRNNAVRGVIQDAIVEAVGGGGATSVSTCSQSTPCSAQSVDLPAPGGVASDPAGNVFFNLEIAGLGEETVADEINAGGLFSLNENALQSATKTYPIAVDAADAIYTTANYPGSKTPAFGPLCAIYAQQLTTAPGTSPFWVVAGSPRCGFSGDGGPATGAEISTTVQGMVMDAAGDFYFTDTGNNRVRRVDGATGIIHTVAGNGQAGYTGDGGAATSAELHSPTGVAVDSQGNVYTTSLSSAGGAAVVRKIGPNGLLTFASHAENSTSAAQTVTVTNTGNTELNITALAVSGTDADDFAVAANSTTCSLTVPLGAGRSCVIGVTFTPQSTGARSAVLTLADDTLAGSNEVTLNGTGATAAKATLAPDSLAFTAQKAEAVIAKSAVLENAGGMPLAIHSFAFTGAGANDFAETHNCGTTLEPGAKCTIDVRFTATANGSHLAALEVKTSAGTATLKVNGKTE